MTPLPRSTSKTLTENQVPIAYPRHRPFPKGSITKLSDIQYCLMRRGTSDSPILCRPELMASKFDVGVGVFKVLWVGRVGIARIRIEEHKIVLSLSESQFHAPS